jgi:hypothetical protein
MTAKFNREERYIVFKISDLGNSLKGDEIRRLAREYTEHRRSLGKEPLECIVVESDWPEYEPTWKAIEARVIGAQPTPESCPCCGEAMRVYSRCLNADCEAVMTTPEQSRYNKLLALMKTCATRLDEPPAPSIPEGWKLVPIEPTPEMIEAASGYHSLAMAWRAAINAAPEAK